MPKSIHRAVVLGMLILLVGFTSVRAAAQGAPPRKDIPAIAKAANGAIVTIVMSDKDGHAIAQGTGFIISKDGLIVTNYHVIAEGTSALVKLPEGAFYLVDGVVAANKVRDVAVIKARGQNFRTLTLGNSDRVQVGEEVVAIGNPLSLESTVSNGIVSGIRTVEELGGMFLQTTAPISPGSSGGPLFNMAGEVIGINTLYLKGGENLNFAIPVNDAKLLLQNQSVALQNLPDEAEPKGAPKEIHADATPSQQKKCDEQSEKFIRYERQSYKVPLFRSGYTDHYDAEANKCFVEVAALFVGIRRSYSISDAFFECAGGPSYGLFVVNINTSAGDECYICPSSDRKILCRSKEEFDDLALKYFGTTPPPLQ